MARINIEEEAHKRVSKLAGLAKCSDREALGTVSYLWGDSQDILRVSGSRDEIIEWAHLFNFSDEDVERWILALEKSRFISCLDDGQYLIHGNEIQIENRISRIAKANKAAKAHKKKWAEIKRIGATSKQSPRSPRAIKEESPRSAMQGKARQCKAEQSNAVQGNAKQGNEELGSTGGQAPPVPEVVELPTLIWNAYRESYRLRYNEDPTSNAKVKGQITHLAKRLGKDAPDVVRFYLLHNKTYYVSKMHEIGACLVDAEALHTQWKKGKAITNADLKRFERSVENHQLEQMIAEGKI
jgi:hypothetical protein